MADDAPKPVKLPFAPTALGKLPFKPRKELARSLSGAESARTDNKPVDQAPSSDDAGDDLDLFKRGREMKSKLAADREREARKRQRKLQEEQARQLEIEEAARKLAYATKDAATTDTTTTPSSSAQVQDKAIVDSDNDNDRFSRYPTSTKPFSTETYN